MTDVIPAILPDSFEEIETSAKRVRGLVKRVQLDIANGTYAETTTWPYTDEEHFEKLISQQEGLPFWQELDYEVDMLIDRPEEELESWMALGVTAAVVHIESTTEHEAIFKQLSDADIECIWALTPSTPNGDLFDIIEDIGMPTAVQVMGNDIIGHHGIELDEEVYDKVAEIKKRYPKLAIAVDIGVNQDTAEGLVEAGATKLVAGSAIFESADAKEAIEYLQSL